ncbi:hypothetical protein [Dendronalium sp. ChiSLP03b]|uniref:antitoxin family protein n=1 Tax=Dendronalium sp. ChiSLP03b TaxID=3075381 RepID=UPI002AD5A7EA|nr:hypothetical protein [Dendronalium sp. ChiSLP03b]MDZ8208444.1 hypothetical protein [Dendronalium sp. ChiSLP03b]
MGEKTIAAVFDGKVFYPLEEIVLPVNTRVRLSIELLLPDEQETTSFLATARSLKLEGPPDWSANIDKYLSGQ